MLADERRFVLLSKDGLSIRKAHDEIELDITKGTRPSRMPGAYLHISLYYAPCAGTSVATHTAESRVDVSAHSSLDSISYVQGWEAA